MSRKEIKKGCVALDLRVKKFQNSLTNQYEEIPELDPRWKETVQFVSYTPLPFQFLKGNKQPVVTDDASLEEWKERGTFINDDLKWLLCLTHNKFWCQVIFDESLHACLDSYLKHAPRAFDLWHVTLPDKLAALQHDINKRVFMVLLRMSTHKESKDCFLTPSTFGEIIYENFLFDIPKIMDICAVYGGRENKHHSLLRKMIENIFDKQPKYYDDLDQTIPTLMETLNNIIAKCGLENTSDASPQKLSERAAMSEKELSSNEVVDIVLYLSDIGHTLMNFMEIFPSSCQYFFKHGFVSGVANLFEEIIPFLGSRLSAKDMKFLRPELEVVMTLLVNVCNFVLKTCCIEPLLSSLPEGIQKHVEDYCQILMSILSEKRFISWYDAQFSIENDLITIQSCPGSTLDATRVEYIIQAIHSAHEAHPNKTKRKDKKTKKNANEVTSGETLGGVNEFVEEQETRRQISSNKELGGASVPRDDVDDVQLDSMTTSVRDLLPGLGEGFVIKCLQEYNYDFEKVINAVLEDNLPESLNKLDRTMDKAQALSSQNEPNNLISTRHSVYDKDEFDVFTQGDKIDLSRVHKGKKRDEAKLDTLLADKSHMTESVKNRLSRYDVYGKFEIEPKYDEYDDEYDDTYDALDVGAQDDDSADELTTRRPFTVPRVLGKPVDQSSESSEEEEGEEEAKEGEQDEGAKTEQQTRWRTPDKRPGNRGFFRDGPDANRGRGGQGQRGQDKGSDRGGSGGVKKGQKGKGKAKAPPDPATLRTRALKERNKGQRANHNRKAGADRKRNKGMGPLPPQ
ncbi:activating signal cointegrator 1 complex subunit 2-like [Actinia tenebrosa]|uniref:Activating signal cointegrator 1 complex subunit 2-like n=1 Tax=Actinia tenebrosa TaxID=6105 RepID=A0A6P8IQ92_ACTTE|nr:activating signal cointegrator 1 complex subunit 2-like [Actinia tenebrosa]